MHCFLNLWEFIDSTYFNDIINVEVVNFCN